MLSFLFLLLTKHAYRCLLCVIAQRAADAVACNLATTHSYMYVRSEGRSSDSIELPRYGYRKHNQQQRKIASR